MTEPTPRPWKFNGGSKVTGWHDGREITVASASLSFLSSAEMDANARLIVRAVNSHDELVAAGGKVLAFLDGVIDTASRYGGSVPVFEGIADLRTAIAKAKGGAP